MKKRIVVCGLALSMIHLVITFVALMTAISGTGDFYGDKPIRPTGIEKAANTLAAILMQPLEWVWTPWMSRHMPEFVEWLLFFSNSLLWGFVAAFLWNAHPFGRRKPAFPSGPGT